MFREKGLSEETLKLGRKIPNQARRRKEILHLLSSFTNFYFFEYFGGKNCWGIQLPMEGVNQLSEEEKNKFNSQTSHWTIRGYLYPNIAEELKITGFTACKEYYAYSHDIDPHSYDVDPLEEGMAFKEQSLFACKQAVVQLYKDITFSFSWTLHRE